MLFLVLGNVAGFARVGVKVRQLVGQVGCAVLQPLCKIYFFLDAFVSQMFGVEAGKVIGFSQKNDSHPF